MHFNPLPIAPHPPGLPLIPPSAARTAATPSSVAAAWQAVVLAVQESANLGWQGQSLVP